MIIVYLCSLLAMPCLCLGPTSECRDEAGCVDSEPVQLRAACQQEVLTTLMHGRAVCLPVFGRPRYARTKDVPLRGN